VRLALRACGAAALVLGLAVPAGASAAHAQAAPSVPAPVKVSMKSFAFNPATVHVPAGGTVEWTYDETPTDLGCESPVFQTGLPVSCPGHSTTAVTKGPDGKPLWDSGVHRANGFPYSHVFTTPGTYHYICVIHGGANANNPVTHMEGDIIVDPASVSAPVTATPPAATQPAPTVLGQALPRTGGGAPIGAGLGVLAAGLALGLLVRRRGGSAAAPTRAGG
jgi:plastocyanin